MRAPSEFRLLAFAIEACTFAAFGLVTCSGAQILRFDVVACVAACIVVMDALFDRVPRALLRHCSSPLQECAQLALCWFIPRWSHRVKPAIKPTPAERPSGQSRPVLLNFSEAPSIGRPRPLPPVGWPGPQPHGRPRGHLRTPPGAAKTGAGAAVDEPGRATGYTLRRSTTPSLITKSAAVDTLRHAFGLRSRSRVGARGIGHPSRAVMARRTTAQGNAARVARATSLREGLHRPCGGMRAPRRESQGLGRVLAISGRAQRDMPGGKKKGATWAPLGLHA